MKPVAAAKTKYGIWGLIVGACVTMIVGFVWGGWTTQGSTQDMMSDAVLKSQATICVAQFKQNTNYEAKLMEFNKTSSYSKAGYIESGGWDKMPGQNEADYAVSQACADELEPTS